MSASVGLVNSVAGRRHLAVRQIDRGRGLPVLAEERLRRCRWWRRRARPADSRCAHRRSPASARRRGASCRSRAAASCRRRRCRGCRRREGRCRARGRGRAARKCAIVARAGAGPWPQITSVLPRRTSWTISGTSPPGPLRCGSTTCSVKAVATAASKALPPRSSMPMPTAVAIQCVDATTPKVPSISGRVVKRLGLTKPMMTAAQEWSDVCQHVNGPRRPFNCNLRMAG